MLGIERFPRHPIVVFAVTAWLIAIALLVLPRLILGEHSFIDPWDYLDSYHAWKIILARTGTMFAPWNTLVPGVFDTGMPRVSFGTQFDVQALAYLAFSPYWATVVLEIIARAIGFWGMFRLVSYQLFSWREDRVIIALVAATTFSLINYIPGTFLSVIGLPLLLSSLIAVTARQASLFDYAYILIFPFSSSLPLVGVFVLILLGLACLALLVTRQWASFLRLAAAGAILAAGYVIADFGLIALKLSGAFETQRSLRPPRETSLIRSLIAVFGAFLKGIFHVHVGISRWLIFVCLIGAMSELWEIFRQKGKNILGTPIFERISQIPVITCLFIIFILCFLARVPPAVLTHLPPLPFVNEFNFGRWLWIAQPIYYLAFALSVMQLAKSLTRNTRIPLRIVAAVLIIPQFAALALDGVTPSRLLVRLSSAARYGELGPTMTGLARTLIPSIPAGGIPARQIGVTYDEYYSPALFDAIERMLGRPRGETRLATIGADPFIPSHNGFQITEGYFQILPLSYYARLRAVQDTDSKKNEKLEHNLEIGSNRAYLFSSDLYSCRSNCLADRAPKAITLDYDAVALHALHIDALLSVSEITNADKLGLQLIGVARNATSPWRFFVYRAVNLPSTETSSPPGSSPAVQPSPGSSRP